MLQDQIANSLAVAAALLCMAGAFTAVVMARAERIARARVAVKPRGRPAVTRWTAG